MERNMEYAHRLYSNKVKIGKSSRYSQVIQININNFSFEGIDKIVDKYYIQNDEGIKLNNKLIFIQIYIPNLRRKCYNEGKDNLSKEEKYALMLVECDVELSKELAEGDILMEEYIEEAMEVSRDEFFGESYDKEWALEDQGRRDGAEFATQEIANNMLRRGINIELISECTGIDVEELEYQKEKIGLNLGESYDKELSLKDQGITDGYEQVLEQVKTTKAKEIAIAMLYKGSKIKFISECTGLSIEDIEKLKV